MVVANSIYTGLRDPAEFDTEKSIVLHYCTPGDDRLSMII